MRRFNLLKSSVVYAMLLMCTTAFVGCSSDDDEDSSDEDLFGDWTKAATFGGDSRANAATFVIGDKGYLVGGFNGENDELFNDVWLFQTDESIGSWSPLDDGSEDDTSTITKPEARSGAIAFSIGTKGYYGTGRNAEGDLLSDFWEFDPATNVWTQLTDFGGEARSRAVGFSVAGKGYVGTGNDGSDQNDFWEYDPTSDTWDQIGGYGGDKRRNAAVFIIDEVAYIGSGENNGANVLDFFSFDGTDWVKLSDLTDDDEDDEDNDIGFSVTKSVGFSIDGNGFLATGNNGSSASSSVYKYTPSTDTWEQLANFEQTAREGASAFTFDSSAYLLLGSSAISTYLDDVYEFFPDVVQED